MKKIGLLGGFSWVSTLDYYKYINEGVNAKLGGVNAAECLIYSFNYADIKRNNDANDWDKTFSMLSAGGMHLKNGGAEALLLCANTMHLIADKVATHTGLPVIHIAEETAKAIAAKGLKKVALLGTKFTMELNFFTDKLRALNIEAIIPETTDRDFLHDTIFNELGKNIITQATKQRYIAIINELIEKGAEGVILGCTEIPLLIKQDDVSVPVFDTTLIHANAAVEFILG